MKKRSFSLIEFFSATSLFLVAFSLMMAGFLFYRKQASLLDNKTQRLQALVQGKTILQSALLLAKETTKLPVGQEGTLVFYRSGNLEPSIEMMEDHFAFVQVIEGNLCLLFQNVHELSKERKVLLLKSVSNIEYASCSQETKGQWEKQTSYRLSKVQGLLRIRGKYKNEKFQWIVSLPDHIEITDSEAL